MTAPINAIATADRAARIRTEPWLELDVAAPAAPCSARITGSSTHGASIIGSVSDEIAPSVVSTRGDSANAAAAMTRDVGLPMPNASATRKQAPEADGEQQRPPQPLRHPARQAEHVAGEEERPVRE